MKAYKLVSMCGALFLSCAGCGGPTGRVKVDMGPAASANPSVVEIFDAEFPPDRPFREIAQLSFDGVPGEYRDVIREFTLKAQQLGADAIILEDPENFTGSSDHLMFRATAISFQDKGEDKGARAAR